jgi:hypothetical protein
MAIVDVEVEEHDALPDGCFQRFHALAAPRPVQRFRDEGRARRVEGRDGEDRATAAWTAPVDDSGAGTTWLVWGGARGVRVFDEAGAMLEAAPYLLLAADAIVE